MEWGMFAVDHDAFMANFGDSNDERFPSVDALLNEDVVEELAAAELLLAHKEGVTSQTVKLLLEGADA